MWPPNGGGGGGVGLHALPTLHARGPELLAGEENGVVVVLGVARVLLLLHEGPAADVLQALRRVPQLDQALRLDSGKTSHHQVGVTGQANPSVALRHC